MSSLAPVRKIQEWAPPLDLVLQASGSPAVCFSKCVPTDRSAGPAWLRDRKMITGEQASASAAWGSEGRHGLAGDCCQETRWDRQGMSACAAYLLHFVTQQIVPVWRGRAWGHLVSDLLGDLLFVLSRPVADTCFLEWR